MMEDDIDSKYVYYDKDLKVLDKTITMAFQQLKTIKERNEIGDIISISKSIFDRRCLELYRSNHPDKLFYLQIDDVTMSCQKDGIHYYISLVGLDYCPVGFAPVSDGDTYNLRSIRSVTDFDGIKDIFIESLTNLLKKEKPPLALF